MGAPVVFVGTSGWLYDWNPEGSLDWYVSHSGLNAVELNASFYRFPYPAQVRSWSRRGSRLRWSVKVHRRVTHVHRLNERALEVWRRFQRLFDPMDGVIDFYLFQLPPSYKASEANVERVRWFAEQSGLGERMAVEFRHPSWFEDRLGARLCEDLGVTFVSIDSPLGVYLESSDGRVYLRMHGRATWYAYRYSDSELREIARRLLALGASRIYVFFNNNHDMLDNARRMLELLRVDPTL